ncbi:MAG: hypothetical protein K8H89_11785 [Flavobacteriales bacterium]|jgi:hypothetical protein|nr:hypothetical protein [Flavobacteriales bacterium]
MAPIMVHAQPQVEWRMICAEERRAGSGLYYDITYSGTDQLGSYGFTAVADPNFGAPQTPSASGEDWYYGQCNASSGGHVVGVLAAGYFTWPNWTFRGTGCASPLTIGSPRPEEFETTYYRKGEGLGYVAMHGLDGAEVWNKCLLPGLLRNATQDADGNFLVVGNAYSNRWAMALQPDDNTVIRLNQDPVLDMNAAVCGEYDQPFAGKGYVTKLNPDGKILWTTMCNGETGADPDANWNASSFLTDIVEVTVPATTIKYCAVGRTSVNGNTAVLRPLIVYLDNDGYPVERYTYAPNDPAGWMGDDIAEFISIDADASNGKLFVTGYSIGAHPQLVGTLIDPYTDRSGFVWQRFTGNTQDPLNNAGMHDPNSTNNSTGGGFVPDANGVKIVWPTMGNFTSGGIYGGSANVATLLVHGLDLSGNLHWTKNLGEVRAYDLQSDMTPTADGKVAVVSSKLSEDYTPPTYSVQLGRAWPRPTSLPERHLRIYKAGRYQHE